jgi:hypothetical protein
MGKASCSVLAVGGKLWRLLGRSKKELPQGFADSALRYTLVYARQD